MNFPESAVLDAVYWLINTPGMGGVTVTLLGLGIFIAVGLTLRWIVQGSNVEEVETYTYPTVALHIHDEGTANDFRG